MDVQDDVSQSEQSLISIPGANCIDLGRRVNLRN
jgi:hypothetical protein